MRKKTFPWLMVPLIVVALLVAWPIIGIFSSWRHLPKTIHHWDHLRAFTLGPLLGDTLTLVFGVCALSSILGISLAWICARKSFPGQRFFRTMLVLPLGIPAYITAFVYVGIFDYAGPVASLLTQVGLSTVSVPIQSLPGCIVILTLGLYPYVYLLCLNAFETQGQQIFAAAGTLGASSKRIFWQVALPFAKPFVLGGLLLVSLEVINDFGAVSILGVNTLTTAVYKMWFGFFSPEGAAQLASIILLIMLFIYFFNQILKGWGSYAMTQSSSEEVKRIQQGKDFVSHRKSRHWVATVYCSLVLLFAMGIPLGQLFLWALKTKLDIFQATLELKAAFLNTALLAMWVAGISTAIAFLVAFTKRRLSERAHPWESWSVKGAETISLLGYGVPGTVLAIAIYLPLVKADHFIGGWLEWITGKPQGLILGGTMFTMILALTIRMLNVAHASLSAGLSRISLRLDDAASMLGVVGISQVFKIHLPLVRLAWTHGFVLVFVDTVKEMPLTLMTRPLGWDFLSVKIFSLVSEGEWEKAALPALGLSCVSLLPFILYTSRIKIQKDTGKFRPVPLAASPHCSPSPITTGGTHR